MIAYLQLNTLFGVDVAQKLGVDLEVEELYTDELMALLTKVLENLP